MQDSRMQSGRGGQQPRREIEQPDFDWQEIDWLEEAPPEDDVPARPVQQRSRQQAPQPQRRSRQQVYDQRPPQRQAPRQQQAYQAPPPRRQPQAEPRRDDRRAVAVEPDDYRRRRKRKTSVPLIILVVILMGGVLFAGGKLGSILLNYHRDRSAYNDLADAALAGLAEPNATTEPGATPEPEVEVKSEVPISVDWDYLHSINTDIIGWLYCPNTMINYPIMQTGDNDYYLHRSYDRQPNVAGALFADYNAGLGAISSNFIVYGHNMKDGSMFATIYDYVTQEFYNQHPIMYLLTPMQNYRIDLISAHIVESTMDNYPGYFEGDEYQNYLNLITSSSFFRSNATVTTDYQLITMSTCDYSKNYRDPRFLLQGMMVPVV